MPNISNKVHQVYPENPPKRLKGIQKIINNSVTILKPPKAYYLPKASTILTYIINLFISDKYKTSRLKYIMRQQINRLLS